jgi:hypothetical protein
MKGGDMDVLKWIRKRKEMSDCEERDQTTQSFWEKDAEYLPHRAGEMQKRHLTLIGERLDRLQRNA